MKKIIFFFSFIMLSLLTTQLSAWEEQDSCFDTALTAGFVFKNDCKFKEVYGHGIANIITADGCYYPWECWGVGAKVSYWRAHGKTDFLRQCSLLQEVPVTFYVRRRTNFRCGLQLYASLGGGLIWLREKSYLGRAQLHKGIGEAEIGLSYPVWRHVNITSAFRYLFPRQSFAGEKVDIGGFDLRAGLEFPF